MKFHLNFSPQKFNFDINHSNTIFLVGSCFSQNIGAILNEYKFHTFSNPNGILFNPLSIATCLNDIIHSITINEGFILTSNTLFYSYLHHSSINCANKLELIEKINSENKKAQSFLKRSDYLIITFGTAFFYEHIKMQKCVANCHKQPASVFDKKLLSVSDIVSSYSTLINDLYQINPKLKIMFTVSPVKHLKDGVVENNLSKATLILAIHELTKQHNNCYYFPAYELVNDDLRDYRFYKEDLAHPNEIAIKYIWTKFSEACFSQETIHINEEIHQLSLAVNHSHKTLNSKEDQKLNDYILKQKEKINRLLPEIEW